MTRAATQQGPGHASHSSDGHERPERSRSTELIAEWAVATQTSLPPLRWLLQPDVDRFAHPAEVELARLLTFYGVRWAYEPTTFAVRWSSDGQPVELVTPDFYLPDHDLYLELTTMRQRLVTRKNRKFRMLREHYPNVRVRILYLRDFERLQNAYGPAAQLRHEREAHIGSTLFDEQDLALRVSEMAEQLVEQWRGRPDAELVERPLLLGVGSGSSRFLTSLCESIRALGMPVDLDLIELTALAEEPARARARIVRAPVLPIAGRPVIVVQEVLSTGLSAAFLEGWLRRQGAGSVEVCALLDREAARVLDIPVACRGFSAPDVSLAGYGLSRWRAFRNLPYIAEIKTG